MMRISNILLLSLLTFLMLGPLGLSAREPEGVEPRPVSSYRTAEACLPPSASSELDINNIRTLLHNGGDMWWDLVSNPRYEVPKGSSRHSLFAGSLWIGGLDEAGQLRVASQTYRQSGYDFWPGPLTQGGASTDRVLCDEWDKMFKINKTEIDAFRADWSDGVLDNPENYPSVFSWPGTGVDIDGNEVKAFRPDGSVLYLAPWVNIDDNPFDYNPNAGDYPDVLGDQAIWWVINDKGDIHTETGGEPIGVEIHMLAFAFATANAINNMTFYKQTVINRSSLTLEQTYLGQWVDPDVGNYADDYVGCDTLRGLGMCYNGDENDEGATGYGLNPPAVGVDFFQGPLADIGDGIDNDKDGEIDEPGETIIMSKFVYYNNDFSLIGNPEVATHYYGYLRGIWKDGTPIVDNYANGGPGNGYPPAGAGTPTNYMFPGDACINIGWTEANAGNPPADRRFLQSAGPFTLQPGAVNEIITGVVWAREFVNDQFGSVCELLQADDVAQALFDNNFQLLDGPDPPQVHIGEYDREFMITWEYPEALKNVNNNFNESYAQADPVLKARLIPDSVFTFQGYIVYQLANGTVGPNELNDPDRARVIAQCDIKDNVSTIVNRTVKSIEGFDQEVIVDEVMVQGANEGIFHSVRVTDDLFPKGSDPRLRNYTTYWYAVVAYAYNDTSSDGRKFVPGNRFIKLSAIPHIVDFEEVGTVLSTNFGDGIPVTQTGGVGNGGIFVQIDPVSEAAMLAPPYAVDQITYQAGSAPVQVKVVNPKEMKGSQYQLRITEREYVEFDTVSYSASTGRLLTDSVFAEWVLDEWLDNQWKVLYKSTYTERHDNTRMPSLVSTRPQPLVGSERVIDGHGFSVAVRDVEAAGDTLDEEGNQGLIGAQLTYDDPTQGWLSGLPDNDDFSGGIWNWILAGQDDGDRKFPTVRIFDKFEDYESLIGGRWAPYCFARAFNNAPVGGGQIGPGIRVGNITNQTGMAVTDFLNLSELPDVDIVFTSDVTNWSRCMVVETSPNSNLGSGAWQLSGKWEHNVDTDGNPRPGTLSTDPDPNDHGMGWFPGYALNVNTGERLNIFFGESTWDKANNGDDMVFNPTNGFGTNLDRAGGRHYVFVTNLRYDEFQSLKDTLTNANLKAIDGTFPTGIYFNNTMHNLADIYKHVAWVGIPMAASGVEINDFHDLPTDARLSFRVYQPFRSRPNQNDIPTFEFDTRDLAARTGETMVAEDALDKILAVPNPYYARSDYEASQLQNIVKITNLPQKCTISIFTLNGYLVRSYKKDSDQPDQNWDLKNQSGVPVASGVYIIHVDAGDLGEKIVKLFVVMRQLDLESY